MDVWWLLGQPKPERRTYTRRVPDEPDDLDGCELDFTDDSVDDETAELLPLFPAGADTPDLEAKAAEWREVLG